jgi:hypothetical protein
VSRDGISPLPGLGGRHSQLQRLGRLRGVQGDGKGPGATVTDKALSLIALTAYAAGSLLFLAGTAVLFYRELRS